MNEKIIDKVRTSVYALDIENRYKNSVYLSGWIIDKPMFIRHNNTNKESVSLVLAQFMRDSNGYAYMRTYHLMAFLPNIVEQFKNMIDISFVMCSCQLHFNNKTQKQYPQIYEMSIDCKLPIKLQESEEN